MRGKVGGEMLERMQGGSEDAWYGPEKVHEDERSSTRGGTWVKKDGIETGNGS